VPALLDRLAPAQLLLQAQSGRVPYQSAHEPPGAGACRGPSARPYPAWDQTRPTRPEQARERSARRSLRCECGRSCPPAGQCRPADRYRVR